MSPCGRRGVTMAVQPFTLDVIGRRLAFFADPSGNLFELAQPLQKGMSVDETRLATGVWSVRLHQRVRQQQYDADAGRLRRPVEWNHISGRSHRFLSVIGRKGHRNHARTQLQRMFRGGDVFEPEPRHRAERHVHPGPMPPGLTVLPRLRLLVGPSRRTGPTSVNAVFLSTTRAEGTVGFCDYPGCGTANGVGWPATKR